MGYSSGIGIGSQRPGVCTSTTKPASPFTGQVIYMTDTDETAVWDGTYWEGLNRSRDRNVIINGAMQIAQRGTSTASITTATYYTADRWMYEPSSMGTWTQSVENDAPTGSGFRKSLKLLCTTADASPAAGDYILFDQRLEGQSLQQFLKGTASAKQFSLTFWVKSNATGTYNVELLDNDNSRVVTAAYTVDVSGTWEKKTVIFPADTTGAFDNDNASSLQLSWWLGAGTNYSSGARDTLWGTVVQTDRAVGQTNLAAATSNYWQITGVQLEAGSVATPFEFEDIGTTLAKCQRYYQRRSGEKNYGLLTAQTGSNLYGVIPLPVSMRVAPTSVDAASLRAFDLFNGAQVFYTFGLDGTASTENMAAIAATATGFTAFRTYYVIHNGASSYLGFSAEL